MNRSLSICTLSIVALLCGAAAHAQVSLSLHDAGGNLSELRVGDTATVEVHLSGVQPGQELDTLAAVVVYDDVLLSAPTMTAGAVVPDPLGDPLDYSEWEQAGAAEAFFLTMAVEPAYHVTGNGTFFSLDVTALAPGAGSFAFDSFSLDATEFNPENQYAPIALSVQSSQPLDFIIVPEPNAMAMLMAMLIPLLWRRGRRSEP